MSRNVKEEAQGEAVCKAALKPGPASLIVPDSRPLDLQDRAMRHFPIFFKPLALLYQPSKSVQGPRSVDVPCPQLTSHPEDHSTGVCSMVAAALRLQFLTP